MKQKDIVVIIVIASIAAILSFFIANRVFVTSKNRQQSYPVVDSITSSMNSPDERFFNQDSINPARNSGSSTSTNQTPFNGTGQ